MSCVTFSVAQALSTLPARDSLIEVTRADGGRSDAALVGLSEPVVGFCAWPLSCMWHGAWLVHDVQCCFGTALVRC